MKNKRKEILRDLLGEFGSSDDLNGNRDERENEVVEEPVKEQEYEPMQTEYEQERQEDLEGRSEYVEERSEVPDFEKSEYTEDKSEQKRRSFFDDDDDDGFKLDNIMGGSSDKPTSRKGL